MKGSMRDRMSLLLGLTLSLTVLDCAGAKSSPHVLYHNRLESLDGILTRDGVSLDAATSRGPAVRIESHGATTVRLAEVQTEAAEAVVLTYRGHLRTANLTGRAYLEMRCSIPGKGDLFARASQGPSTGTTDWVTQVTRLSLGNEQRAQTVRLNVQIDGSGVVWVHNILLAQAAR
jgi:hypothetical protein